MTHCIYTRKPTHAPTNEQLHPDLWLVQVFLELVDLIIHLGGQLARRLQDDTQRTLVIIVALTLAGAFVVVITTAAAATTALSLGGGGGGTCAVGGVVKGRGVLEGGVAEVKAHLRILQDSSWEQRRVLEFMRNGEGEAQVLAVLAVRDGVAAAVEEAADGVAVLVDLAVVIELPIETLLRRASISEGLRIGPEVARGGRRRKAYSTQPVVGHGGFEVPLAFTEAVVGTHTSPQPLLSRLTQQTFSIDCHKLVPVGIAQAEDGGRG